MTGPKEDRKFCFPETPNVSRETKLTVFRGTILYGFCYTSQLKNSKRKCEEIVYLAPVDCQICRGFKEHDLITWELKVDVVVSLGS